jgi:alpha,alpha-trehalase
LGNVQRVHTKAIVQHLIVDICSDVCDAQGGTISEGIHVAMMAASINMLLFQICGIDTTGAVVKLNPRLPKEFGSLALRVRYQQCWLNMKLTQKCIRIHLDKDTKRSILVSVRDKEYKLLPNSAIEEELQQ